MPQPNLNSVRATLIEDGFAEADLRPSTLVSALKDKKKDHIIALAKSAEIIKELVYKSLHSLLNNKTVVEMWTILRDRFQHISPMSITRIFIDAYNAKLSNCKDVIDYTSRYQIAFDKILSLINEDSWMSKRSIEMILQGSLLQHLGKDYSTAVSAIETGWTEETTNLSDIILRIIRHAEIKKRNEENSTENVKVLATEAPQTPKSTCTTQEYIYRGSIAHFTNWCRVTHLELRVKYSLRHMGTRKSNRSLRKAATPAKAEQSNTLGAPEIDSWQPKILAMKGPRGNSWLVDSATDVHVCNNKSLMMGYQELPTRIGGSTSDGIS